MSGGVTAFITKAISKVPVVYGALAQVIITV
jgi:hypothetical protein